MILFLRHLIVTKHLEDAVSIMIIVIRNSLFFLFLSLLIAVYFYSASLNKVNVNLTYRSTYRRTVHTQHYNFFWLQHVVLCIKSTKLFFFSYRSEWNVNLSLSFSCSRHPTSGLRPPTTKLHPTRSGQVPHELLRNVMVWSSNVKRYMFLFRNQKPFWYFWKQESKLVSQFRHRSFTVLFVRFNKR